MVGCGFVVDGDFVVWMVGGCGVVMVLWFVLVFSSGVWVVVLGGSGVVVLWLNGGVWLDIGFVMCGGGLFEVWVLLV